MNSTYAQKSSTVQKATDSNAASVLDSSSQRSSLQRKADMANSAVQREERPNNTGMPDNLKSGIESLSGFSMDDVRVHYNSSKPATVQALAYTQGTDIHVAPGQEKCLPHEAWHVAQQMAGRVSPTTNINGMPVNDNAALEHEADVMGERAVTQRSKKNTSIELQNNVSPCMQMKLISDDLYYEGLNILFKISDAKKNTMINRWVCISTEDDAYVAVEKNYGEYLRFIISTLKKNHVDATPFYKVKKMLINAVKQYEKNKKYKDENDEHFQNMCCKAIYMCLNISDENYKIYFGEFADLKTLDENFEKISQELMNIKNNCRYVNAYSQPSTVFAYVKSGDVARTDKRAGKIRLCSAYRNAKDDGHDSKPGVLIHETSHLILGTKDYKYGVTACKELAKNDPSSAIKNADSYEYAAEH